MFEEHQWTQHYTKDLIWKGYERPVGTFGRRSSAVSREAGGGESPEAYNVSGSGHEVAVHGGRDQALPPSNLALSRRHHTRWVAYQPS